MLGLIIQYLVIVLLVLVLGFLMYVLKGKGLIKDHDYYGITFTILRELEANESMPQNVKAILREISDAVQFVEQNFKFKDNTIKEEKALEIAKEGIERLHLESKISDESIKYIIKLSCAILPPTHEN